MSGEPGLRALLSLDHGGIWLLSSAEVEVFDVLLDDASLLHRDPPAERSRLLTRRFVAAAVARWWDQHDRELLCAQIVLHRFVGPHDATLAAADGWIELAAGGAVIDEADGIRLAVMHEQSTDHDGALEHAATFGSHGAVCYSVVASSPVLGDATRRVRFLAKAQFTALDGG